MLLPPETTTGTLHLLASLSGSQLLPEQIYAMPVEFRELQHAAAEYSRTLEQLAGSSPVLDLVHLGIGPDGHTASLIPGDPVLTLQTPMPQLQGPLRAEGE